MATCTAEETCANDGAAARGWCWKHYQRWRRTGKLTTGKQNAARQGGLPDTASVAGSWSVNQPNGALRSAPDPQASRGTDGRRGRGARQVRAITSSAERAARRDQRLRQYFGITLADYKRLFEAQGGRCAVCRIDYRLRHGVDPAPLPYDDRRWQLSVDHDHRTGRIRGLLCNRHNLALSQSVDDYLAAPPAAGVLDRVIPESAQWQHERHRALQAEASRLRRRGRSRVFTEDEKATIRRALERRTRSVRSLARTYGVNEGRIREIRDTAPGETAPEPGERTTYTYGDHGLKAVTTHPQRST